MLFTFDIQKTLLLGFIFLIPILPNLWGIWHIFRNDFPTGQEKMGWIGACIFLPILGGIAYIFIGKKRILPYTVEQTNQRTEK